MLCNSFRRYSSSSGNKLYLNIIYEYIKNSLNLVPYFCIGTAAAITIYGFKKYYAEENNNSDLFKYFQEDFDIIKSEVKNPGPLYECEGEAFKCIDNHPEVGVSQAHVL